MKKNWTGKIFKVWQVVLTLELMYSIAFISLQFCVMKSVKSVHGMPRYKQRWKYRHTNIPEALATFSLWRMHAIDLLTGYDLWE